MVAVIPADTGGVQQRRPHPSLLSPGVAAASFAGVAFVSAAFGSSSADWTLQIVAGLTALVTVIAGFVVPWERVPPWTLLLLPLLCDLLVGLLRDAHGGGTSGFAPLLVLPAVWVGFVAGRAGVLVLTAGTAATLVVPIVAIGGDKYPATSWRGAVLLTLVVVIVGLVTEHVVRRMREDADDVERRASLLDRLVRTQTAIALSSFGIDDVLETVVDEALDLTRADAAVVEVPDGEELVYRAVAGTAVTHLGFRVPAAGSASGYCLATMEPVVIADTEVDDRVDRDAARAVGARSMVIVPLIHAGRAAGVLKVYSATAGAVGPDEARVLGLLGGVIGSGLVRAEMLATMEEHALTDALTGLANRRSWDEQLARAVAHAERTHETVSVAVCDVNGLKHINDTQGHAAGDLLIREIASTWRESARASDLVARLGGDEFAVLLPGADEVAATDVVERLVAALPEGCSVSFGIAEWDLRETGEDLMTRADLRMYDAKRRSHTRRAAAPRSFR